MRGRDVGSISSREMLVSVSPVRVSSILPASVQFNEIENYSLLKEI
jgi:hypothetical protein